MKLKKIVFIFAAAAILFFSCTKETAISIPSYLELNLCESVSAYPFALKSSPLEVFRVIEKAANDTGIKGIILNIETINYSRDHLWELRSTLENFKASGKKIVAYISNADIDVYMLATAADKIIMDELGLILLLGYSAGQGYFSQTLEKLGIGVTELRYFEYKSAAESFTRTNMSDADRKQYSDYLDDIFNLTRSTLMNARGWTEDEFNSFINKNFMHSAQSAMNFNLIDAVGKNSVKKMIDEIEDQSILSYCYFGDESTLLTKSGYGLTRKYSSKSVKRSQSAIALVYADGVTDMAAGMEIGKLCKIFSDLEKNSRVKAIVVRMNSTGGSANAADALAEAIRKSKKPVVVSMEQVAASGGYWASLTADHIMATPYTITGSIGVIGSWFYDKGFYEKLGLTTDIIKRGDHSDLMSGFLIPYRNLSADEEEQYKNYILALYGIFVDKTAQERNMDKEEAESRAQGRIYSGLRALDEGLIDSIGNLSDAIAKACELAEIPDSAAVIFREYPEPSFLEKMISRFPASAFSGRKGVTKNSIPSVLDSLLNDAEIQYRLTNSGQAMPLMPLEWR